MKSYFHLVLAFASPVAAVANAQIVAPAVPPAASECARAVETLARGSLIAADSQTAARDVAATCGETAALAGAITRWRTRVDTAAMLQIYSASTADAAVMNAAIAVAADSAASEIARVLSIRLALERLFHEGGNRLHAITSTPVGHECVAGSTPHGIADPRALPASIAVQARMVIASLEGNPALPLPVRSASNCFMNAWRIANRYPIMPIGTFTRTTLQVRYVCRNQFRVLNSTDYPFDVLYTVDAGPMHILSTSGRVSRAADGETLFEVAASTATVVLYLDGVPLNSATGTNSPCPGGGRAHT